MTAAEDREALAAALPEALGPAGLRRPAIPELGMEPYTTPFGEILLDALLPVVDAIARRRAAEELRAAAAELLREDLRPKYAAEMIRDRADALTDHEETR